MINDNHLTSLIQQAEELTRQLEEIQAQIHPETFEVAGEFVQPCEVQGMALAEVEV